jgi:hypothetical protein
MLRGYGFLPRCRCIVGASPFLFQGNPLGDDRLNRRKGVAMRCLMLAGIVALLAGAGNARGAIQWSVTDGGNGHYYEFVNAHLLWPEAKAAAESMTYLGVSGHLATVTSPDENDFVLHLGTIMDPNVFTTVAWIGLTDNEAYGGHESFGQPNPRTDGWVWITGEPVSYTDWGDAPPNNADGNEDFCLIGSWAGMYGWNDQSDYFGANYIVEFDTVPEPSTLIIWSLLGGLGIGIGWWRRRRG